MSTTPELAAVPLPRGRHKLSRERVRNSQRERLTQAMLDCVSARGYGDTKLAEVVAAARVSRTAFYEFFEDKESCFLAACDEVATQLVDKLYARAGEGSWTDALRLGVRDYLEWWRQHPNFAVAYLVDLPTAGRRALEQRDRAHAQFLALFEALATRARDEQRDLPPVSGLALRLIVPAITEIVAQEIRAGRLQALPELEAELTLFIAKTLANDRTAQALSRSG